MLVNCIHESPELKSWQKSLAFLRWKYTISSISGKNLTNQEKRLLIGATYANVRSWDIRRKKRPRLFDRVHKDSKWQKLFSRGHYNDYWFIYLWGSFVETISLFTGGAAEEKKGEWEGTGWGLDLWVELCTPPKYWHSTSPVVETKVLHPTLQTLTFQPGCFIARPTVVCTRSCPDYWELFGFPLVDGFSSKKGCEWQRCLSFRWWQQSLFF